MVFNADLPQAFGSSMIWQLKANGALKLFILGVQGSVCMYRRGWEQKGQCVTPNEVVESVKVRLQHAHTNALHKIIHKSK